MNALFRFAKQYDGAAVCDRAIMSVLSGFTSAGGFLGRLAGRMLPALGRYALCLAR